MALTSSDETDLLLPLHKGVHEEPRFATFLARLQRRTGADHVGLTARRTGASSTPATTFFAGEDLRGQAHQRGIDNLATLIDYQGNRLRPGRVYSVAEFTDHDPAYRGRRAQGIERLGIADERVVRVSEDPEISAWLMLARRKTCTAADSALLSSLAPYIAAITQSLIATDRLRNDAILASEGLRRAGTGWIAFDTQARILAIETATAARLQELAGIVAQVGHRLQNIRVAASRILDTSASELAGIGARHARPVVLSESPRIEALLSPADAHDHAVSGTASMIALCRFPRARSASRSVHLAELFDLPAREAQLAIALCDGQSIAEAARTLGLTLETARNYSKRLYAKLHVRGQAELVGRVHESIAILA